MTEPTRFLGLFKSLKCVGLSLGEDVWNLLGEAGGQQQIVLLLLDDLVPLCRGLEESLLGLTQLSLVLALLFIIFPGFERKIGGVFSLFT